MSLSDTVMQTDSVPLGCRQILDADCIGSRLILILTRLQKTAPQIDTDRHAKVLTDALPLPPSYHYRTANQGIYESLAITCQISSIPRKNYPKTCWIDL